MQSLYSIDLLLSIGRGDNVWISPKGCLMFSIPLIIPSRARIVKRLSILQHLVALSVVTAIRTKDGGYKVCCVFAFRVYASGSTYHHYFVLGPPDND